LNQYLSSLPTLWIKIGIIGAISIAFLAITWGVYSFLPLGVDWYSTYRPAALEILALRSPYNITTFYNPPWILLPFLPFAYLPAKLGYSLIFSTGILGYAFICYRLGVKPAALFVLLFSYPILFGLSYGQIDWLVIMGVVLPPQIGLFFVVSKPQIGLVIVIFWLVEMWRKGGLALTVRTFIPVITAFLLSFIIFGVWYINIRNFGAWEWNTSLWPHSLPIGIVILISTIRSRKINNAMIASPFLSPYVAPHGWGIALIGLANKPFELTAAVIGLWILRFMTSWFF
jgi:hypothetical protein